MTQVNRIPHGGPTVDSGARAMRHVPRTECGMSVRHAAGLASSGFMPPDGERNAMRCEAVEMKQRVWAVVVLLALSACAGAERNAAFRSTETQLFAARQAAALPCSTPAECDRAWRVARRYVEGHSSTRITRADADTIETAPPFLAGEVYVWASRTASGGGAAVIRLKAMCKGMYDSDGGPGWRYDACATKILDIERGFRADVNPARSPDAPKPVAPR
ncbi:hypothetical protein [Burkholderia cepacia]|uniref:hypothetical protein n=1 Tax=Burkholderia cepacia TaxID=292 RepID=UPI0021AB44C9|nr:hypothetical protein [Burkholderia cepacia]